MPGNEIALLTHADCQADKTTSLLIRPAMAAAEGTVFPRKEGAKGCLLSHQRWSLRLGCPLPEREEGCLSPLLQLRRLRWFVVGPRLPKGRGQTS